MGYRILDGFYIFSFLFFLLICSRLFLFASFRIPGDSMEPTLQNKDRIIVNKLIPGARIFNLFAAIRHEPVEISRLPGLRKITHDDVIVFHYPYSLHQDKIKMDMTIYHVKRVTGQPGDSLSMEEGRYMRNGKLLPTRPNPAEESYTVFFSHKTTELRASPISSFPPLYIPRAGDVIVMDSLHFARYRHLMEWEQKEMISYSGTSVYIDGAEVATYRFLKNYYFVTGDNQERSIDSRHWGLLPEEFIVGKASRIWKSFDPHSGKRQWKRFMKKIE